MKCFLKLGAWRCLTLAAGLLFTSSLWAGLPIQHWTAANGAKVYLVESPALPMVDVQIDFDAGARRDPSGQAGLASATAQMMSKGVLAQGALPALDENALGEAWADLGALFSASAGSDRLSLTLRTLTVPDLLDGAIRLAARQLAYPRFPADVWANERDRSLAALKEASTRPGTVAQRRFASAVHGDHPYGNEPEERSLMAIQVADMKAFHARHLDSCRARVSLVGALNRAQAEQRVLQLLAGLPSSQPCPVLATVAEVQPLTQAQAIRVPFDAAQAHVLMGQPGFKRNDPDFFPLTVGNYILGGGGFVSRLTEQVREKRGLSYSVYSYFAPGMHAGPFVVGLQTRPDQAEQALQVARDVVREFVSTGPTQAELKAAKDNLMGSFPLRLDSNRKWLDNLANMAWHELPLNYLDTWTDAVARVTVDDVRAAFQRKLQPERMVTVTVGAKP